ncbi:MAG TPA: CHAT domain-containing tetratricopeptide repeat protein [Pyrinomonadaceae bacterium]
MERLELAARLVAADDAERNALLEQHASIADLSLAHTLKDICLEDWSAAPLRAEGAAKALRALALVPHNRIVQEIEALALWIEGFAAVVAEGELERALSRLEDSEELFLTLGKAHAAASTCVIKLYALALLGRYDEAIACGLRGRDVLLQHGDIAAAAKIEHNIGNIYLRRDRYDEAEKFQLIARERFKALNDRKQLAKVDNNLAIIYSSQHQFRRAEKLYQEALGQAEASGSVLTQAEIEASSGNLALFRGQYDRALDYLERSRRKYTSLGMPHLAAVAELEIADAYLELNLAPEAVAIYERVARTFHDLGMQGERARSLAQYGRALITLNEFAKAHVVLLQANELYEAEGNRVGSAMVQLTEAQLFQAEKNFAAASDAAKSAADRFSVAGAVRWHLLALWLCGESLRAQGEPENARRLLEKTLHESELKSLPDISQRCHTSLGLLALGAGQTGAAEQSFAQAVAIIEDLRAPLPAEEFRAAYFAARLIPYNELMRLCLDDQEKDRAREALGLLERARSRALVDALGGAFKSRAQPVDEFDVGLRARLDELKEELSWFYSHMNRATIGDRAADQHDMASLHQAVHAREQESLEITRQLERRDKSLLAQARFLDVEGLQRHLSTDTAFVEYTSLAGEFLAFVVTDRDVKVVRGLGNEDELTSAIDQLAFQLNSLRYGSASMRKHLPTLTARIRRHLEAFYEQLVRPLAEQIGDRNLIIAPHRALYYVPFHALYDGSRYVTESRVVTYAPSATVLLHCLAQPHRPLQRALLMGLSDAQTPRVHEELAVLGPLFPESMTLENERATLAALQEFSSGADVVHLACHGQFRPDNPLFSSLKLGDGWLTVRDTYDLTLKCALVSLSACETGLNRVAPGDELIGLARGFLSAGAPSLLLSLWTVDDDATANLMTSFYRRVLAGNTFGEALRQAQIELIRAGSHPFFWAPFVIIGRP